MLKHWGIACKENKLSDFEKSGEYSRFKQLINNLGIEGVLERMREKLDMLTETDRNNLDHD